MVKLGWFLQQSPIDGLRRCRVEVIAETPARYRVRALAPGRGPSGGSVAAGAEFLIKKFQFTPDASRACAAYHRRAGPYPAGAK